MEEYSILLKDIDECKVLYKYLLFNNYEGVRYSCLSDIVDSGRDIHECLSAKQTCTVRKDSLRYIGFGHIYDGRRTYTLEEFLETDNRVKI
jgi:hypothetical protein